MRVLRANHGFDYSFLYAIFMGNVLQPLNPHIGYADLVGHKLCADEHLISPSSSIWKLPSGGEVLKQPERPIYD